MRARPIIRRIRDSITINRKSEWVVFFWCVLIATLYWFLQALNERYSTSISLDVDYINVPEDQVFSHELPEELLLRVNAPGWELLGLMLDRQSTRLYLDVAELSTATYFIPMNQRNLISRELPEAMTILDIKPDTILLQMEPLMQKWVPITLVTDSIFAQQHGLAGPITIEPDSVLVSGPASVLEELEQVPTEPVDLEDITRPTLVEVALEGFESANLRYSEPVVRVQLPIEKLTEGQVEVPVEIQNLEEEQYISLIPQHVTVTFQTALSNFPNIYPNMFSAVVNGEAIDTTASEQLQVELANQPPFIQSVRISPEYVDYIILQEETTD